ncbi:hypothetical protein [Streptomyces sp. BK239]|uniref:hypothetical protein n=1 Tax=Streptomyces sp. BK239 TaxID=2512155 RepID=UPI00102B9BE0|nr:hypothetical protein [Streptomyces sp. BK239]
MSGGLRDPWAESAGDTSGVLGGGSGASSAGLSGLTGLVDEAGAADDDHDPDEVTVQLDSPPGGSSGNGQDASEVPVFVDESGRRSRTFRRIGIAVGLACAAYAVVIVGTLLSGNSSAPWLPVPGPKDDEPARQVDTGPQPSASSGGTGEPEESAPDRPGSTAPGVASASPAASASPSARASAAPPSASASPGPSASASLLRPSPEASSREPSLQTPSSPAASSAPPPSPSPSASPSPDASPSPAGGAGTTVAGGAPQPAPAHDTSTTHTTTSSAALPVTGATATLVPPAVTGLPRTLTPGPVSAARLHPPVPGSAATVPVFAVLPGSTTAALTSAPRSVALPGGLAV